MIGAFILALVLPGLFAPPFAAQTLGVEALDAGAQPAATEILRELQASGNIHALAIDGDPAASDCRNKPYAAAVRLTTSTDRHESGWTFDAGLVLVDCAGWSVEEWHCYAQLAHPPSAADAEKLAMDLLLRFRTWIYEYPAIADALLRTGLAYDAASATPTYFYALFKTDDGNMRAWVRPGGPAFEAGLRTNDVIEKLDGKYWWEYGTYQTEQRAYDGKPHEFLVKRGQTELLIRLGDPYVPPRASSRGGGVLTGAYY